MLLLLSRVCNIRLLTLRTTLNKNILNIYKNDTNKSLVGYSKRNIWHIARTAAQTSNVTQLSGTTSFQLSLSGFSKYVKATNNRAQATRAIAFGTLFLCVVPLVSYCVLEVAVETIVQEVVETTKGK